MGVGRPGLARRANEPVEQRAFVLVGDRAGDHEGIAAFADGVRERAAAKRARVKPALQPVEDGEDRLAWISDRRLADDRAARHIPRFQIGANEIVLRREMIVDRSPRDAGTLRDRGETDRRDPLRVEELVGCRKDRGASRPDIFGPARAARYRAAPPAAIVFTSPPSSALV